MLWQGLRALCKAPGGAGSNWKYLEALARATGVTGRFDYSSRTKLHFADVHIQTRSTTALECILKFTQPGL